MIGYQDILTTRVYSNPVQLFKGEFRELFLKQRSKGNKLFYLVYTIERIVMSYPTFGDKNYKHIL